MLRVREIAQRCSVDRGKIYRFINQNGIQPVEIDNGVNLYDDSVVRLFKQFEQSKHIKVKDFEDECLDEKQSKQAFSLEKIKMLESENAFLRKQLSEQNAQIKELHTLLHEANQNYLALGNFDKKDDFRNDEQTNDSKVGSENEQNGEQSEQVNLKESMERKDEKKGNNVGWFRRIFRK